MTQLTVQETLEQEEDTQKGKFLTFALENEAYGIEIRHVIEIIGIQPVAEVPGLPAYIRGIINLRGKIIPVMDVRFRFNKAFREYNDRTCIIVIDINDVSVGLIVDNVSEVLAIREDEIVAPPEISMGRQKFIKAIGKVGSDVKLLLDCEKLLGNDEIDSLSNIA